MRALRPKMRTTLALTAAALLWLGTLAMAQRTDAFVESRDHPAIRYGSTTTNNAVAALNAKIRQGEVTLRFDETSGYLRSVLDALGLPVESQMLVYSPTSFQASLISMRNPRALYFSDSAAVGWVRGADVLEVAVHDPAQGVLFYQIEQQRADAPQFTRSDECLACHLSWETLGVPGFLAMSTAPRVDDNAYAFGFTTDHRSPLRERWGGWYVTGNFGTGTHMGNVPVAPAERGKSTVAAPLRELKSVDGLFDLKGFPSSHSDVAALLVFAHQARAANLLTRIGWEARVAGTSGPRTSRVGEAASELVDYFLFVDEAPIANVRGSSAFSTTFAAMGPRDDQGRSLRQLDLQRRLMKYPCSYMIYSEAFEALPAEAKTAIYTRLWQVLSGEDRAVRYRKLTLADRRAVIDILRQTKDGLPDYFSGPVR